MVVLDGLKIRPRRMTMSDEEFINHWRELDCDTKNALKNLARNPTRDNAAYMIGYIGALADRSMLKDVGYWMAIVNTMAEGNRVQDNVLHSDLLGE